MKNIVERFVYSTLSEIGMIEHKIICAVLANESFEKVDELQTDKLNRQRVARIISIPESEWSLHAEVFNDFDIFSNYLNESPLNDEEKAKLSLYFIRKNIACGILAAEVDGFDAPKIKDYAFKYITAEEVEDLIRRDAYRKLIDKDPSLLTEHEKHQIEDIKSFIKDNPLDLTDIINKHKVIKDHYFDKEPNLTKDDLQVVIKALYEFNFDKSIIRCIRSYIYKTCNFEIPQNEQVRIPVLKNEIQLKREMLSKKQYYMLEQELKKYFDINNMKVVKELSAQDEIYCLYIMKKMKLSTEEIYKVLKTIKKTRKSQKHNPVEQYLYLFDKIKYYSDNSEVNDKLKELEHCFNNLFIADEDTYFIFKEYIRLLLDELEDLIPESFDYEFKAAEDYSMKLA